MCGSFINTVIRKTWKRRMLWNLEEIKRRYQSLLVTQHMLFYDIYVFPRSEASLTTVLYGNIDLLLLISVWVYRFLWSCAVQWLCCSMLTWYWFSFADQSADRVEQSLRCKFFWGSGWGYLLLNLYHINTVFPVRMDATV